jgi:hypothetical protein
MHAFERRTPLSIVTEAEGVEELKVEVKEDKQNASNFG